MTSLLRSSQIKPPTTSHQMSPLTHTKAKQITPFILPSQASRDAARLGSSILQSSSP